MAEHQSSFAVFNTSAEAAMTSREDGKSDGDGSHDKNKTEVTEGQAPQRQRQRERQLVSSGSEFEARIGYSRAVVTGDWVFVSGCTGYDYATGTISPDIVEQAEQAMKNIDSALRDAGSCVDDVVRVRYIVPQREEFPRVWPVLRRWFGGGDEESKDTTTEDLTTRKRKGPRPAATMMSCGLMEEIMKIEIEVTARKGSAFGAEERCC